ncbi:MAG TPA: ABC transporter ATP-binding protein [Burkholderiaceae bacterium]|nr:ABC transporter ATP-binding protein [Burkholderiaceae bacterium]
MPGSLGPAPRSPSRRALVLAHVRAHGHRLAAIVLLGLLLGVPAALQPWPLKLLLDHALGAASLPGWLSGLGIPLRPMSLVLLAAAASLLLFCVGAALESALTWLWSATSQRMVQALAGELFLHLQGLSLLFHARRPVGDSMARITTDAWCIHAMIDGLFLSPLRHLVVFAAVAGLAWQLDPGLSLLTFAAAPLLAASALYFGALLKGLEHRKRDAEARLGAFLQQVFGALPMVQAFAAGARNRQVFGALAGTLAAAQRRTQLAGQAYGAVNAACLTLGMALVLFAGGRRVLAQELTLGSLFVFLAYFRTLEASSRALLQSYGSLRAAQAGVERVLEILATPAAVVDAPGAQALSRTDRGAHLVFEHVGFGYEPGRPVLQDLCLEIPPGRTLALVGMTGAGKSTLASMVPRLIDPQQGRILVDGQDLRTLRLASLREQVAMVLQEPFLLPLTVAGNIAYGCGDAPRDAIVAAAMAAHADEFIRALPQGYDTVLGEQGAPLSGGQRQRLAIARAMLRNARVLVLDEPTSALDGQTEQQVVAALQRLRAGRTTLVIAHRLSTVRSADQVAVLADGRVAELGTHAELLAAGGRYARLHALQGQRT